MNKWERIYDYVHPSNGMKISRSRATKHSYTCSLRWQLFYSAFVLQQVYVSFSRIDRHRSNRSSRGFIQSTLFPTLDSHDPTLTSFVACSEPRCETDACPTNTEEEKDAGANHAGVYYENRSASFLFLFFSFVPILLFGRTRW